MSPIEQNNSVMHIVFLGACPIGILLTMGTGKRPRVGRSNLGYFNEFGQFLFLHQSHISSSTTNVTKGLFSH